MTTTSATAHAPKPEGGTRPLALFSELLKRTEALAAKRLMDVAAIAPPGSSLAGYNVNDPSVNVSDFVETARSITEMKGN